MSHHVESYLGAPRHLVADVSLPVKIAVPAGAVTLSANGKMEASAEANGSGAAALDAQAMLPSARVNGALRAYVRDAVDLNADALTVRAGNEENPASLRAVASSLLVSIAAASGRGVAADATVDGAVEAFLGAPVGTSPVHVDKVKLNVSNLVTVESLSSMEAQADADGGGGGGISVSVMLPEATMSGRTQAYLGEGIDLVAGALDVRAESGKMDARATVHAVIVAGLSGSGADAVARTDGAVEAFIGAADDPAPHAVPAKVLVATGSVQVSAISDMSATATSGGGIGSGLSVSVMLPTATTAGATRSFVGSNVQLRARTLDVTASARSAHAVSSVKVTDVRVIGGTGANATAMVTGTVEAFIGGSSTDLFTTGRIGILATTEDTNASAAAFLGSGGILDISAGKTTARNTSATRAFLREGTVLRQAGSLDIQANSIDVAGTNARVQGGGVISGRGMKASTVVRPTTEACIGQNTSVTALHGVGVSAIARIAEGDAESASAGGGAIDVGVAYADLTVEPTVRAFIGEGAVIHTHNGDGDVTVTADLRKEKQATASQLLDTFHQIDDVDLALDAITFPEHGLRSGDVVTYDDNGESPLRTPGRDGTLEEELKPGLLREYSVRALDDDRISLGAAFNGIQRDAGDPFGVPIGESGVDGTRDLIVFETHHHFETGDAVKYDNGDFANVGTDLNTSSTFYVRKIDDRSIKLATTKAQAESLPLAFDVTSDGLVTDDDTLNIIGHGFQTDDRVTYYGPETSEFNTKRIIPGFFPFTKAHIDLRRDTDGDGKPDRYHNLTTGDKVLYLTDGSEDVIPELVDGTSYWVIRSNQSDIQLAATKDDAIQGRPIDITGLTDDASLKVRHLLIPEQLGNLVSGATYSVEKLSPDAFNLRDGTGKVVNLAVGDATGTHFLGREGMQLTPAAARRTTTRCAST
jgi:hypothetical protein